MTCAIGLGVLMIVGSTLLIPWWSDALENVSLLEGRPEMAAYREQQKAEARLGGCASLLYLVLGVALIPLGVGQRRGQRWVRAGTLLVGAAALVAALILALLLWLLREARWQPLATVPPFAVGLGELLWLSRRRVRARLGRRGAR